MKTLGSRCSKRSFQPRVHGSHFWHGMCKVLFYRPFAVIKTGTSYAHVVKKKKKDYRFKPQRAMSLLNINEEGIRGQEVIILVKSQSNLIL